MLYINPFIVWVKLSKFFMLAIVLRFRLRLLLFASFFIMIFLESAIRLPRIVLTQKVIKKVKTGSFCLIPVYFFIGIGDPPMADC